MMVGIKEALKDRSQTWLRAEWVPLSCLLGLYWRSKTLKRRRCSHHMAREITCSSFALHSHFPDPKRAAVGTEGCSWVGQEMEKGEMEKLCRPAVVLGFAA